MKYSTFLAAQLASSAAAVRLAPREVSAALGIPSISVRSEILPKSSHTSVQTRLCEPSY